MYVCMHKCYVCIMVAVVSLQAYIQRKSDERRRKALQKRAEEVQAAKDKDEKLKKLYEAQRVTLENNLRQQQRAREVARKLPPASAAIHIHIRDTTSESVRGAT